MFDLLQNYLFELHDLTVAFLRSAEDGPSFEEDAMWDSEYFATEEDDAAGTREAFDYDGEPELPVAKQKPKGLTALKLLDPSVPSLELALILKDVSIFPTCSTIHRTDARRPQSRATRSRRSCSRARRHACRASASPRPS